MEDETEKSFLEKNRNELSVTETLAVAALTAVVMMAVPAVTKKAIGGGKNVAKKLKDRREAKKTKKETEEE